MSCRVFEIQEKESKSQYKQKRFPSLGLHALLTLLVIPRTAQDPLDFQDLRACCCSAHPCVPVCLLPLSRDVLKRVAMAGFAMQATGGPDLWASSC